jgi:hypothetical protein
VCWLDVYKTTDDLAVLGFGEALGRTRPQLHRWEIQRSTQRHTAVFAASSRAGLSSILAIPCWVQLIITECGMRGIDLAIVSADH